MQLSSSSNHLGYCCRKYLLEDNTCVLKFGANQSIEEHKCRCCLRRSCLKCRRRSSCFWLSCCQLIRSKLLRQVCHRLSLCSSPQSNNRCCCQHFGPSRFIRCRCQYRSHYIGPSCPSWMHSNSLR